MNLPNFKYHPDPLGTGSVKPSDVRCVCCNQRRGFIYTGPVYSLKELGNQLCPWCIADGSAHEKYDAEFTEHGGVGSYGFWDEVPAEVIQEVAWRTPGFSGWQQERWWTHCSDAAEYLGVAGEAQLEGAGPDLIASLQEDSGQEGESWEEYLEALKSGQGPTAYLFRCRHCGRLGGYSDCD